MTKDLNNRQKLTAEEQRLEEVASTHEALETLGSLSQRARVGHCA